MRYGLRCRLVARLTLRVHLPNTTGLSPNYASKCTELLWVKVPRFFLARQAGPESHDLDKDQIREGWINFFDYQSMRELSSGNALGIRQDFYDSSPFRTRGRHREM